MEMTNANVFALLAKGMFEGKTSLISIHATKEGAEKERLYLTAPDPYEPFTDDIIIREMELKQ